MGQATFMLLPIMEISLDAQNPRIALWIEMYGDKITAEQMSLALGAGMSSESESKTTFHSLREAIRTSGGIIHPILVNRETSGKLLVIEGNTRTMIYREFIEQKVAGNWEKIPAMVYDNLTPSEIDGIRLQAHLVGPREWDPYSKAKYLNHLRKIEHLTFAQIVDFCGGRKREVQDYIDAYNDMEAFYRPVCESRDEEFLPERFSSFMELQRPRIVESLVKSGFTKHDFANWVAGKLLSPQSTVRALPRILGFPKAKEIFLRDGAQEAMRILDVPTPDQALNDASLLDLAREISRRVLNLAYEDLLRLRANVNESENICEARDNLQQLCSDIASFE